MLYSKNYIKKALVEYFGVGADNCDTYIVCNSDLKGLNVHELTEHIIDGFFEFLKDGYSDEGESCGVITPTPDVNIDNFIKEYTCANIDFNLLDNVDKMLVDFPYGDKESINAYLKSGHRIVSMTYINGNVDLGEQDVIRYYLERVK